MGKEKLCMYLSAAQLFVFVTSHSKLSPEPNSVVDLLVCVSPITG